MLENGGHISFNKMGDNVLFPIKVHINESSMASILSFEDIDNIAGVHIKMHTPKFKLVNVHIED